MFDIPDPPDETLDPSEIEGYYEQDEESSILVPSGSTEEEQSQPS